MTPAFWALPLASVALAICATWALWQPGAPFSAVDVPNERSLHVRPTPRTGGLAIVLAVAVCWLTLALGSEVDWGFGWVAGAAAAVAAVSFADDRGGVRARYRFLVHAGAAALLIAGGSGLTALALPGEVVRVGPIAGPTLTLLFVVWMTNLYNFMDGMDGFAGGMAVAGFAFLGYAFAAHGDVAASVEALIVAGASLGFLRYNFPPARIFLGDVGAAPLGFVAAALMLRADRTGAAPLWASILAFSPFVVDATVTLLRRAWRREKVWLPHRSHYYQRLVLHGWGHKKTVLAEYVAMAACGLGAVLALHASSTGQWAVIAIAAGAYACAMLLVSWMERRAAVTAQRASSDS